MSNTMKTYNAALANDSGIFDSADNFESISALINWAEGRGGKYVIHIDAGQATSGNTVSIAYDSCTRTFAHFDGWDWEVIPADRLSKYIDQYI